jgi:hypothetical protein
MSQTRIDPATARGKLICVCPRCGSDQVHHDAVARWNAATGKMELAGVQDYATCAACDYEDDDGTRFFKLID